MSQAIAKLIVRLQPEIDWRFGEGVDRQPEEVSDQGLASLLRIHNGFSAFKGGLRVFGTTQSLLPSIDEWNRADVWRCEYQGLDQGLCFFAEDFLGNQFGFDEGGVFRFLAETGDRELFGQDFQEWLEKLLAEPVEELGLWLLDDWLSKCNRPKLGEHLCPKIPFVAKGPTEGDNLYACERVASMKFKGHFAHQIRSVRTGEQVNIRVT